MDDAPDSTEPPETSPADPDMPHPASPEDAPATKEPPAPAAPPSGGWIRTVAIAIVAGATGAVISGGFPSLPGPDPIRQALNATYTVEPGAGQSGSAVLVTDEGHLMTSAHLVDGQESVAVTSYEGVRETALVVGVDPLSDLAVLRLGTNPRGHLSLREDEPAIAGEEVIAIGAPFGFRNTVTRGIVSGGDRVLRFGDRQTLLTGLIQTDASINPGNSGGPLVDTSSRLIGINTAISTTSGTSQGVGFAVPAATVRRVLEEILANGEVAYARLGVDALDTQDRSGARVVAVVPGGTADQAGLQVGDIITLVNSNPVRSSGELVARIREMAPGDTVHITVERYGEPISMRAELQKAPAS